MKLKYICNNYDYKTLRDLFNNNLFLRNNAELIKDSYIPKGNVYDSSKDLIVEIDVVLKEHMLDLAYN